ncbi:MAG: site-2 protease family protein [Chloroflexota bacterium]
MNLGSLKIGRIAGIDIQIHWSWLAIFAILIYSLANGFFKDVGGNDWSAAERWTAAVITTILFFLSVLLHELSHSLVAKRLGLTVSSITLFLFGGVSALTTEPESARDEFRVAIVGPLMSFFIAAIAGIAFAVFLYEHQESSVPGAITGYLAFINLSVGIFNMLPGYPLDGGRVLRSALWARSKNVLKATRWASASGTYISFGLFALGGLSILLGGFVQGVWFIIIGWFLRNASDQAYQQVLLKNTLEGTRVGDLVNHAYASAPPDMSVQQLVTDHILGQGQRCVPIVVAGDLLGLITMTDLQRLPSEQWGTTSVFRAMTPREKLLVISPEDDVTHALEMMAAHNVHQLPVIDQNRTFLGFITRGDVLHLIHVRTELGGTRTQPPAAPVTVESSNDPLRP